MGAVESCTKRCARRSRCRFEEVVDDVVDDTAAVGDTDMFWPAEPGQSTRQRTPEQTPEKAKKECDGGQQSEEAGTCDASRAHWSPGVPSPPPPPPPPASSQPSIYGQVYAQQSKIGLASLHFVDPGDAYVSYEAADASRFPSLDDGSRPPARKAFEGAGFEPATRTFVGSIKWAPTTWDGEARRDYEIVFAEDMLSIQGGCIRYYGSDSAPIGERIFGRDVWYKRVRGSKAAPGKHSTDKCVAVMGAQCVRQVPNWSGLGAPVAATTQTSLALVDVVKTADSLRVHTFGHHAEEVIESEIDCAQVTSDVINCCASNTGRTAKMVSCVQWPPPLGAAPLPAPTAKTLSIFDMSAGDAPELHEPQVVTWRICV